MAPGEVRRHQPDQVTRPEPAHPGVGGEPAGDKERQHAEKIRQEKTDADRLALLRTGQFIGQRGNAQHVIDGKQTLENDEAGDHGKAGQ